MLMDAASAPQAPIFIVGCHRSGTTLLRLVLDSHPDISCGPETRFLTELLAITSDEQWPHLQQYGFPKAWWHQRIAEFFGSVHSEYARRRGKRRWADKTPRYALSVAGITELFPTCQVVHVIRDGRDVVASHRHRWGYLAALKAVLKWRVYVEAAQAAGTELPADRYYEVRYEDLVADTEATVRKLLDFLGEPWDDAMLDFDRKPHDVQPRYAAFTSSRRAAGDDQRAIYRWRVGAHRHELDPLLRAAFRVVSGRMLRKLGYS
jgi:hypothetical protein